VGAPLAVRAPSDGRRARGEGLTHTMTSVNPIVLRRY
jgi:hypothetical protein